MRASRSKPAILVVDDHPSIATTLAMILEAAGYTVATAGTGRAAIDTLAGVAFDLALIDIHLPDTDGITLAREICKQIPPCKILLMTGSVEGSEFVMAARRQGLEFDVIAKPIPPPELLGRLSKMLEEPSQAEHRKAG